MSKAKLEHEELNSTMATAVALFNECIKWCIAHDIGKDKMPMIARLFEHPGVPVVPPNSQREENRDE